MADYFEWSHVCTWFVWHEVRLRWQHSHRCVGLPSKSILSKGKRFLQGLICRAHSSVFLIRNIWHACLIRVIWSLHLMLILVSDSWSVLKGAYVCERWGSSLTAFRIVSGCWCLTFEAWLSDFFNTIFTADKQWSLSWPIQFALEQFARKRKVSFQRGLIRRTHSSCTAAVGIIIGFMWHCCLICTG